MENKKKLLSSLVLAIILLFTSSVYGKISTPVSVNTFYSGMRGLLNAPDENMAYDISKSMNDCFYGMDISVSGISLPNDFRFFDYDKKNNISHNDAILNSATYVNRLKEYIYNDRVMKVEYRILKSEVVGTQPDFHKGRFSVSNSLVSTCVAKVYILNGFRKIFNDTIFTDFSNGKICEIKNGNGTIWDINTLRNKAAQAYRLEQYNEAYKCYEQIISIKPNDTDALYRIGLMTYFQYSDCGISKKQRKIKAKVFLEKAQIYDNNYYGIREKAKNVLFWLKYNV